MMRKYTAEDVAIALRESSDAYMQPMVASLRALKSDADLETVMTAVAELATSVPKMGPVTAFEVIYKLGRYLAARQDTDT